MALLIGDNFNYQAQKPNFERDSFSTLAEMKAFPETSIDDGHISYCAETDKHYKYLSANTADDTTGKWREFFLSTYTTYATVVDMQAAGGNVGDLAFCQDIGMFYIYVADKESYTTYEGSGEGWIPQDNSRIFISGATDSNTYAKVIIIPVIGYRLRILLRPSGKAV